MREFAAVQGGAAPAVGTSAAAAGETQLPPPFPQGSASSILPEPNEHAKSSGAPCVMLAGKEWPIPLLAPRQNRVVVPGVTKITRRMREIAEQNYASLGDDERQRLIEAIGSETELRNRLWKVTDFSFEIIQRLEPEFFDTIADALYCALTRAHPQLTRQAFDDMPIGMAEMVDAMGIVAQQTGMMRKVEPSAGPLAAGPESASPSSQTGTPSSPTSATG
jgi:hypothetical protein